jgi:hypothetical protein
MPRARTALPRLEVLRGRVLSFGLYEVSGGDDGHHLSKLCLLSSDLATSKLMKANLYPFSKILCASGGKPGNQVILE